MKTTIQIVLLVAIAGLIGTAIYYGAKSNPVLPIVPTPNSQILSIRSDDHIRGNQNADITLVEYSDFQCPYCIKYHLSVKELIEKNGSEVRWIYRHFPLPIHPFARAAAEAVEAAGKQNKFWEYADKLSENSQPDGTGLKEDDLIQYAGDLGLNLDIFNKDRQEPSVIGRVEKEATEAQNDLGIQGTPASYLISKSGKIEPISGYLTYDQLKAKVDEAKKQ